MTYFNKRNPWFWAFVVLLILNVSAIGTMVYTINKIHNDLDNNPTTPPTNIQRKMTPKMGRILEKRMGYSKEQMKTLRGIRIEHLKNIRGLKADLQKLQSALFDEISSSNPKAKKIDSLKKEILKTHSAMIDESNTFYNKVKDNSSEEQLKKLNNFYKRMLFHHGRVPYSKRNRNQ